MVFPYFLNSFQFLVLVGERMQTFANLPLYSAQMGPYWSTWRLTKRLAPLLLPCAIRCSPCQLQENSLLFCICKC